MSLLEQDTIRKKQINNKALPKPKKDMEFEAKGNKEYVIKAIIDSAIYSKQANNNKILGLYYLVLWKGYPVEENTWELSLVVIYLQKFINTFYKEHPEKLTAIFLSLDSAPLIAKPMVPKKPKQKHDHLSKGANKKGKK